MPCYNYSSNDPIYYNPNAGQWAVERVYTASGTTYSYGPIAIMCELPAADQLCVYTRASAGAAETKLTLNLDYTVTGSPTENIVLTTGAVSGQVVIRRCTPNDKMLFQFLDGAKITAKQLNVSLHQLLFLGQEKEWVGATNNHFYPLSASVAAWSAVTAYTVGQYALQGGVVYQCKANSTNNAPPNATYWTPVNFVTNGFIIQGGATLSGPVTFNLSNVTVGNGLVWNGTQFEAGTISGILNNLSDVDLVNPASGHILVYDGISQWRNRAPTVDITQNNLIFKDFVFVDRNQTNLLSYTIGTPTPIQAPSVLNAFKNFAGDYVIPDVPTTYHILKRLIPDELAPETFFLNINTAVTQISSAITNPVKAQLYWNLNRAVPSDDSLVNGIGGETAEPLVNYKISYWDSPHSFYNSQMLTNINLLTYHGITTSTNENYRDNPYFYKNNNTFISKVTGKKIKAFYLNVPECYTTALCNIPISTSGTFTTVSTLPNNAALTSPTSTTYRDEYLTALRDFAFAGVRSGLGSVTTVKQYDHQARYAKSFLLSADYNGFEDVSYKRLELTNQQETATACLFKIPKQIIYYNKKALTFIVNEQQPITSNLWPETAFNSSAATNSTYSSSVRFTGTGELTSVTNTSSTINSSKMGGLFKADVFWGNWTSTWTGDSLEHFNEADIDWIVSNVTTGSSINLYLWDLVTNKNGKTASVQYSQEDHLNRADMYPWPYRPNYWEKENSNFDGYIGTHHFNFDSNRLFSDADLFVPNPRDEYVFRIVLQDSILSNFDVTGSETIASALILEHGFNEHPNNALRGTVNNTKEEIYRKNRTTRQIQRTKTRLDKNDVKVYIQSEHFETQGQGSSNKQYVINLCISVPRLKAIGYARVFRNPGPSPITSNVYTSNVGNNTSFDTDADLGSWTFYLENDAISNDPNDNVNFGVNRDDGAGGQASIWYMPKQIAVAGRNECAVKFTRLGIPNNLWIRLSVLNTNGTTSLISDTEYVVNN